MKRFHHGKISKCYRFQIMFRPWFVIQFLNHGYYFGWFEEEAWNYLLTLQKERGNDVVANDCWICKTLRFFKYDKIK